MAYAFGARSLGFCKHVHPALMGVAGLGLGRSPVDFGVSEEQSRTRAEQQKKFDTGVSKVRPGPKATHMIQPDGWSRGLDLAPWIDGAFQWGDNQWRVRTKDGRVLQPFFDIAAAMRAAAIEKGERLRWGAIWDRCLNDLPADAAGLRREMEAYKVRHPGPDFIDGPHFELLR